MYFERMKYKKIFFEMKRETSLFLFLNGMFISSWALDDVCDTYDIQCQNSQIPKPGEIIYGQCYRNATLRRLQKVSFLTCLKECMKTSTCSNVSYRRGWKMCDINGNLNSDIKLIQEHGCFSSNINLWSRALVGKCAQHNCAEGYKCVLKEDEFKCELAYCVGNPNVHNAQLNEQFGLSRDLGHGMMYKCMKGMKISGKPFAVCRETGKWKSMFVCDIPCEKGWIEFSGHCYYIGPDKKTWEDSKADCQRKGSYLVKIEDASENIWLQKLMTANNIDRMWIGAHDNVQEGTWRWIKDNTIVDFTNWGDKQPNNVNGNQNCAGLWGRLLYRWNDYYCKSLMRYICEK